MRVGAAAAPASHPASGAGGTGSLCHPPLYPPDVVDVAVMGVSLTAQCGCRQPPRLTQPSAGNGEGDEVDWVQDSLEERVEEPEWWGGCRGSARCEADARASVWQRMSCSAGTTRWTC